MSDELVFYLSLHYLLAPHIINCIYLGYIEGEYVYLSSPVSGRLIQLAVHRGETVTVSQLAFQLDPQPELAQLKSAQTNLVYTRFRSFKSLQLITA